MPQEIVNGILLSLWKGSYDMAACDNRGLDLNIREAEGWTGHGHGHFHISEWSSSQPRAETCPATGFCTQVNFHCLSGSCLWSLNPVRFIASLILPSIGGQILQIGLSSFAAYTGSNVQVQIGDAAADILGKTAHGLDVVLPGLAAGWYNVSVILNGILIGSNG